MTRSRYQPGPATDHYHDTIGVEETPVGGGSGLPSQWTDGGNGDITATTDDTSTPLTVTGTGDVALAVTEGTDGSGVVVGDYAIAHAAGTPSQIATAISATDSYYAILVWNEDRGDGLLAVQATEFSFVGDDGGCAFSLIDGQGNGISMASTQGPSAAMSLALDGVELMRLKPVRVQIGDVPFVITSHTLPADGDLNPGEVASAFDQTNGAAKMLFKGKSANGTVVTGSVNLT